MFLLDRPRRSGDRGFPRLQRGAAIADDLWLELAAALTARGYARAASLPAPPSGPRWASAVRALLAGARPRSSGCRLFEASPSAAAEYAAFANADPQGFTLLAAWFLIQPVSRAGLEGCLGGPLVGRLLASGVLAERGSSVRSTVRIVPYAGKLFLTDPPDRSIQDFAYLGRDSIGLADFLAGRLAGCRFERGLDLCTGVGIHALLLADVCREVVGVDLNPRALDYARRNALINRSPQARFICADVDQAAEGAGGALEGAFDVIVSNPPFRFLPEALSREHRDGFGGELGLEKTRSVLRAMAGRLAGGGLGVLLTVAPVRRGENLLLRLVADIFGGTPRAVHVVWTDVSYSMEFHDLYRGRGITHFLSAYVTIEAAGSFRLTTQDRIARKPLKHAAIRLRSLAKR